MREEVRVTQEASRLERFRLTGEERGGELAQHGSQREISIALTMPPMHSHPPPDRLRYGKIELLVMLWIICMPVES